MASLLLIKFNSKDLDKKLERSNKKTTVSKTENHHGMPVKIC